MRSRALLVMLACAAMAQTTSGDVSAGWESAIPEPPGKLPTAVASAKIPSIDGPRPFDPLSPTEQQRATALAMQEVMDRSDRLMPIGASLYTHKDFETMPAWPRIAEVWTYDYENDETLQVLVDLGAGMVQSIQAIDVFAPLTAAEIQRAGDLALGDRTVVKRLADLGVPSTGLGWTARPWDDHGGKAPACATHRCVLLAFQHGDRFVFDPLALVDLSADRVAGVLDGHYRWLAGREA